MPIEFICSNCGTTLRVGDEAADKQARCPQCSTILKVPTTNFPLQRTDVADDLNPYSSPTVEYPPKELPSGKATIGNQVVEAGQVINYAFEVWKRHLGLLVGVVLVVSVITNALSFVFGFTQGILEEMNQEGLAVVAELTGALVSNIVNIFLSVGQVQIFLKLARGQNAGFEELFQGGERFLPTLGVSILLGLAFLFGLLLFIVPGILLALMWWPAYYLVVDNRSTVMDSFSIAKEITQGNWGTAFLLWLTSFGIIILGFLALCVGILFAAPLVAMIWCVAYLMMSGQLDKMARY